MPANVARLWLTACAVIVASSVRAQSTSDGVSSIAAPAWWGGSVDGPEAGFEQIISWCKGAVDARKSNGEQGAGTKVQSRGPTRRMVVSADRKLAILGQVASSVPTNANPRMARRLAASQAKTDRLRFKEFCLRAAWIAQSKDPMERVVVFEGFNAIRTSRNPASPSVRRGSVAIQGTLPGGIVFKDYEHRGVTYSVALFRNIDRARDVTASFGDGDVSSYAALGALHCGPAAGVSISQVVAWAMSRSKAPEVVLAAMGLVGRGDGDVVAAKSLWQELKGVIVSLCVDERERSVVQGFLRLAGVEAGCAGHDARGLTGWMRDQDFTGFGLVVMDRATPVLAHALRADADVRLLRDHLLSTVKDRGRPRPDDIALDWYGEVIALPPNLLDKLPEFAAPSYDLSDASWLLVHPAATAAPVFQAKRVRVSTTSGESAASIARRAMIQYIIDRGLWALASACDLVTQLAEEDLQRFVAFQVPVSETARDIDLLPSLKPWLEQQALSASGSFRLVPQAPLDGLDIAKILAFERWRADANAANLELRVRWQVGEPEAGKDKNVGPGRANDWVRLPIKLTCEVAVMTRPTPDGGDNALVLLASRAVERNLITAKTYGGHDPRQRLTKTIGDGLATVSDELSALLAKMSRTPAPVEVVVAPGVTDDVLQRLQTFGGDQLHHPVEGAGEAGAEPNVRRLAWPGGRDGLQRVLNLCASTRAFEGVALAK